jgi:hypothetical protein
MKKQFGFIVLAPEPNVGLIKTSMYSLHQYGEMITISIPSNTNVSLLKNISPTAKIVKGGNTITSLINAGFNDSNGWQIVMMAGTPVADGMTRKYNLFIENELDVLFSVVPDIDRQGKISRLNNTFSTCTLNGIAMHADVFKKVGNFKEQENLYHVREEWEKTAIMHGCIFKGIVGLRMS